MKNVLKSEKTTASANKKDFLSTAGRSLLMSRIRSKGTAFEKSFVKLFRTYSKARFRRNVRSIRGCPDLMFPKAKVCVFLDSDFWHGWQFPRWSHLLKSDFWVAKIQTNRKRDRKTTAYLRAHGWKVVRIWEHQIRENLDQCISLIVKELEKPEKARN